MNDDGINVSVESKFLLQPKVGDNGYQNQKKHYQKASHIQVGPFL